MMSICDLRFIHFEKDISNRTEKIMKIWLVGAVAAEALQDSSFERGSRLRRDIAVDVSSSFMQPVRSSVKPFKASCSWLLGSRGVVYMKAKSEDVSSASAQLAVSIGGGFQCTMQSEDL